MVSYAIDCGVPAMAAATVFGAAGVASLSGRVIGGLAADRIGAKRMIVFGLALQALSVSLYVFTRDLASFYGLALMFGFSYGAVMPLYAILVREYFGAPIMGMMFSAVNVASAVRGPEAGSTTPAAAISGSYIGSFAIGLGAIAIALTFRPPRELSLALPGPSVTQRAQKTYALINLATFAIRLASSIARATRRRGTSVSKPCTTRFRNSAMALTSARSSSEINSRSVAALIRSPVEVTGSSPFDPGKSNTRIDISSAIQLSRSAKSKRSASKNLWASDNSPGTLVVCSGPVRFFGARGTTFNSNPYPRRSARFRNSLILPGGARSVDFTSITVISPSWATTKSGRKPSLDAISSAEMIRKPRLM
jgi:MFS family permease